MGRREKAEKLHYGWVIVFSCMLLSAAGTGLLVYFNALFVAPVTTGLGISRAGFLLLSTFSTVTTMLLLPFAGGLFQKYSMRRLLLLGTIIGAGAFVCFSLATGVVHFYIGGVLTGFASCLYGAIPIALLTTRWFNEKRGLVTGISFTGAGIISVLLSAPLTRMIEKYGWRNGYRLIALATLLIMIPNIFLLIKERPEDMGLKPYGDMTEKKSRLPEGYSRKQAVKLPSFWLLATGTFLLGMITTPAQQQLVAWWGDNGNSSELAAGMYSFSIFVSIFAKILLGGMFDKLGVRIGAGICGLMAGGSFVALLLFRSGYLLLIPAMLFGTVTAIQVVALPYLTNQFFGDREYGAIYGLITPVLYLGVSLGIPLSAMGYDFTGSYGVVWAGFAVTGLLSMGAIIAGDTASRGKRRQL